MDLFIVNIFDNMNYLSDSSCTIYSCDCQSCDYSGCYSSCDNVCHSGCDNDDY